MTSTSTTCRPVTTPRRTTAVAAALVLLAALVAPPAVAASGAIGIADWGDLQAALNPGCPETTTVQLMGEILNTSGTLTVNCDAVLDLNGEDLTVRNVVMGSGKRLTIKDASPDGSGTLTADARGNHGAAGVRGATLVVESGTVTARGGPSAAGIAGSSLAGGVVTISGGTVNAYGGDFAAGIGGSGNGSGGSVTISGGTVDAEGGANGAGIGGGFSSAGGVVTISGGTVNASGGKGGAGIGGGGTEDEWGTGGHGGTVDISGGHVAAAGGSNAAGIGGGSGNLENPHRPGGVGATMTVTGEAVVTATGGHTAIGTGYPYADVPSYTEAAFGSLTVGGTLRLPPGNQVIPTGAVITVAAAGKILGAAGSETVGANFAGGGEIVNDGVIGLAAPHVTGGDVKVSGNHYAVTFDPTGGTPTPEAVTVFAPSFDASYRTFPVDPTQEGWRFGGWTDRAGAWITSTSRLPGSSEGTALAINAFAHWTTADATASTITAAPDTVIADGTSTSTITVQAKDASDADLDGGGDFVVLETTAGILSSMTDHNDGTYTATLTSTAAGTATITGTLNSTTLTDNATVEFTAVPTPNPSTPTTPPATPTDPDPERIVPTPPDDRGVPSFVDVTGNPHEAAIERIHRYGITSGVSETLYNPAGMLSRGQMSSFAIRLLVLTHPDIDDPDSHEEAVRLLAERGVLLGHNDGNLNASGTLTRGQAASLLVRLIEQLAGETLPTGTVSFPDAGDTHGENIAKLATLGVISGYEDNTYRPHLALRRDQAASLIARTIDKLIEAGKIGRLND